MPDKATLKQRIIFIDDGSPEETVHYQESLCTSPDYHHMFICLNTTDRGYTRAVVLGVNHGASLHPVSDAIVLLNSDTIVTSDWLLMLYGTLVNSKNDKVKMVGPLSMQRVINLFPYFEKRTGALTPSPWHKH